MDVWEVIVCHDVTKCIRFLPGGQTNEEDSAARIQLTRSAASLKISEARTRQRLRIPAVVRVESALTRRAG